MRSILSVFFIFFITKSCFAAKPAGVRPAFQTGKEKKSCLVYHFFNQQHPEDESNLVVNDFEHPTSTQPLLKKQTIVCIQLLYEYPQQPAQDPSIKTYTSAAQFGHQFIYHLLFPKHFFW